ncbi:MAG: hypothetical protein C5B58_02215, partial [Acidobacteria bacterium]
MTIGIRILPMTGQAPIVTKPGSARQRAQNEIREVTMNAINTQEHRRFRRLRISMLFGTLFS